VLVWAGVPVRSYAMALPRLFSALYGLLLCRGASLKTGIPAAGCSLFL
jgi:hypothetical protein